ncbi:unnamed protein product [Calypogeia fissa]
MNSYTPQWKNVPTSLRRYNNDQPTFTLNFSKGASQIIAQYYQFLRLGFEGYRLIMANCQANAATLCKGIEDTGKFEILSKVKGVPVIAFSLKDRTNFDEYELSAQLRSTGWIVPAYTMAPDAQDMKLLRIVVREDFSLALAERLLTDLFNAIHHLDERGPKMVKAIEDVAHKTESSVHDDDKVHKKYDIRDTAMTAHKAAKTWKKSLHRGGNGVC